MKNSYGQLLEHSFLHKIQMNFNMKKMWTAEIQILGPVYMEVGDPR